MSQSEWSQSVNRRHRAGKKQLTLLHNVSGKVQQLNCPSQRKHSQLEFPPDRTGVVSNYGHSSNAEVTQTGSCIRLSRFIQAIYIRTFIHLPSRQYCRQMWRDGRFGARFVIFNMLLFYSSPLNFDPEDLSVWDRNRPGWEASGFVSLPCREN